MNKPQQTGTIAENRRARWRFQITETWDVGVSLTGQEVKSVKTGHCDLHNAFVTVRAVSRTGHRRPRLEAQLVNCFIPKYDKAGPLPAYDPRRTRKLLLKRSELTRMLGLLEGKGLTVVPLRVYTSHHLVKLHIGLARGKSKVDKREAIREREVKRSVRQAMRKKIR